MNMEKTPEKKHMGRILITRTDRLGDVVLSTPVIRYFRERYPDAYIAFMVRPENKGVVMNNPHLDEVITYDKYGAHKSFLDTVKFSFALRSRAFDTVIILHPTNRDHMIAFLAGIPRRIGYDRKMGFLLTDRVRHLKHEGDMHEARYNFKLLEEAGFEVGEPDIKPYIITAPEDKQIVDRVMKDFGIREDFVAIHAGASCISKRWEAGRFAKVADVIASKYAVDIVLVGGDETAAYSSEVVSGMVNKAIDLTGVLLLSELAELLSRAKLFISNDSGPVHVAVGSGTPVISIFGRKDPGLSPKRWGPLGEKDKVVHKDAGCRICLAHNCEKNFSCLKAVTPEEVIEAAEVLLNTK
ncbi:MAG: lipopolysaccharide heptosyltransferase II [Candidatus Omnitrophota bacterium]